MWLVLLGVCVWHRELSAIQAVSFWRFSAARWYGTAVFPLRMRVLRMAGKSGAGAIVAPSIGAGSGAAWARCKRGVRKSSVNPLSAVPYSAALDFCGISQVRMALAFWCHTIFPNLISYFNHGCWHSFYLALQIPLILAPPAIPPPAFPGYPRFPAACLSALECGV